MRKVIYINEPKQEEQNPVKFTHYLCEEGFIKAQRQPSEFERVVYLGKCESDVDMFAAYGSGCINIYKGHLNSGTY